MVALKARDERRYSGPEPEGPHAPTEWSRRGRGSPSGKNRRTAAFLFAFGGSPSPPSAAVPSSPCRGVPRGAWGWGRGIQAPTTGQGARRSVVALKARDERQYSGPAPEGPHAPTAACRNVGPLLQCPVLPNPPAPRSVEGSSFTSRNSATSTLAKTSWAIRIPRVTVKGSRSRFTIGTWISPR